ncbi:MAG: glycosyltransferase family 4 protein [Actinomycetota bacterium]|nr:glycosyltransferase family 4 protein [Actinomycetota bacterium]
MRISIVCPYAWDRPGGVQSHVRSLAGILRDRGHDVQIIAPSSRRDGRRGDDATLVGRAVGIPANGSVAPIAFGPTASFGVRHALESFRPDVVHLHEPLIPSLSLLALTGPPAPSVGTFHAAADSSLAYRVARRGLDAAMRRLHVRTAVSDQARALIARYFPGEYLLTPNGIDARRFTSAEPLDLGPGKKVLFFGRIERRKGLEVLTQAMTRLRDLDARIVVGGTGPEERAGRLLARRLAVPAQWLGRIDERDVGRVFRSADVYCAPGVGGESFGYVVVEAMAAGTPVVCSDLPGYRAVAGGAAELVPPGQPGPLADALRRVLSNPEAAARMGKAGTRLAGMYDWKRLVPGVERAYEQAIDRARA